MINNNIFLKKLIENKNKNKILSSTWFHWPSNKKVHIVALNVYPGDAIGNFVFDIYSFLTINKIKCSIYAAGFDDNFNDIISHVNTLKENINKDDIIFYNFSIYDPYFDIIKNISVKKIFYYHGITPPKFFQEYEELIASQCKKGYEQFENITNFDFYLCNSDWSAKIFKKINIGPIYNCPPVIGLNKWNFINSKEYEIKKMQDTFLYVGRISAHKKIEDLLYFFHEYKKINSNSQLIITGSPGNSIYSDFLKNIIQELDPDLSEDIIFTGFVTDSELKSIYKKSDAFITMSAHEGFCVPLVEAMFFKLPIFAFAQGAIQETLGNSGIVFKKDNFSDLSKFIYNILRDNILKEKVINQQNNRYRELEKLTNGQIILKSIFEEIQLDELDESTI